MDLKPEIIAFITSYFPAVGGAEVALRQVAERLCPEFDFLIVTARGRSTLPRTEVVREGAIWRLGIGGAIDKWLLPVTTEVVRGHVRQLQAEGRRMILWGMDITQASLAASLLHRRHPGIPFVLTVQYGESHGRLARGRMGLIRRSFEHMLGQADHVTAISKPLEDLAHVHGYRGPTSLIPNGVDLERFRPPGPRASPGRPTLITTSRLVGKNGIDTLLRTIQILAQAYPAMECRIVGDGPLRPGLEDLAARLGIRDLVRFYGSVPHEDIPRHLWESDVFIRASRSEGMGNSFVEAMAAGVPVIGTGVVGLSEIVMDRETGLLARVDDPQDLADKIRLLLTDPFLAARLARQALTMVSERFSLDVVARKYAFVFEEVLQR